MVESILNTVLSLPYLLVGVGITAILDYMIHKSKATTRFTSFEICGGIVGWPLLVCMATMLYFGTNEN